MVNKARVFCNMLEQQERDSLYIEKADEVNKPYINEYRERVNNQEGRFLCKIMTVDDFENHWYAQTQNEQGSVKFTIKNICPWIVPNHILITYKEETRSEGSIVVNPYLKNTTEGELLSKELSFHDHDFLDSIKNIVG